MRFREYLKRNWYLIFTFILLELFVGMMTFRFATNFQRAQITQKASTIASTFDATNILALSGSTADYGLHNYIHLKRTTESIKASDPGIRFVYLTGQNQDYQIFFYVDDQRFSGNGDIVPGGLFSSATANYWRAYERGETLIDGPYDDDSGRYITAIAPIVDQNTGRIVALLSIDWSADLYIQSIGFITTASVAFVAMILLIFVFVYLKYREEKEIEQAKGEFISITGHQLKTPLTTIRWYSEMLLGSKEWTLTDKQKTYVQKIEKNCEKTIEIVTSLLNISRIELSLVTITPKLINLTELAESVLDELGPRIETRRLSIIKDYETGLPQVNADPEITRIIFQNLLSNAIKYTGDGGKIFLTMNSDPKNINITVKDTGIGVPKDVQSKIFNKMYRADNAKNADPNGTGLGLYIIKLIVEKIRGKIWFVSEVGVGSTFFVTLPLRGVHATKGSKRLG